MTNREIWSPKVFDEAIELSICHAYLDRTSDFGYCPGCPISTLCEEYLNSDLTHYEYMAKITDWLNEEAEDDGSV